MIYRLCYCTYLFVLTALWLNMNNLVLILVMCFESLLSIALRKIKVNPQSVGSSFIRNAYAWFSFLLFLTSVPLQHFLFPWKKKK